MRKSLIKDDSSPRERDDIEHILLKSPMKNRAFSPPLFSPKQVMDPVEDVDYLLALPESTNRAFGFVPNNDFGHQNRDDDTFLKIDKPAFQPAST